MKSSLAICLSVLVLIPHAFAQRGGTPAARFKPYVGNWRITESGYSALVGAKFTLFQSRSSTAIGLNASNGAAIGGMPQKLGNTNGSKRKFQTTLSFIQSPFDSRLGRKAKVKFSVPKGDPFTELNLTIIPDDSNLSPVKALAVRTGDFVSDQRTIVTKFRRKGAARPGKKLKFTFSIINRGPSLMQDSDLTTLFTVGGPVKDFTLSRTKRMKSCVRLNTFVAGCVLQYLGAPIGKKDLSQANVNLTVEVADSASEGDMISIFVDSVALGYDENTFESIIRSINIPVKASKKDSPSGSGLSGLFQLQINGRPGITFDFRKEGAFVNGYIHSGLTAAQKALGFSVGEKIYRKLVLQSDGSYVGEAKSRLGGRVTFEDITFNKDGRNYSLFGSTWVRQ